MVHAEKTGEHHGGCGVAEWLLGVYVIVMLPCVSPCMKNWGAPWWVWSKEVTWCLCVCHVSLCWSLHKKLGSTMVGVVEQSGYLVSMLLSCCPVLVHAENWGAPWWVWSNELTWCLYVCHVALCWSMQKKCGCMWSRVVIWWWCVFLSYNYHIILLYLIIIIIIIICYCHVALC